MSRRMHRIKRLLAIVLIVVLALPANIMLQNYQVVAAQKPILSNTKVSLYLNQNAVLSNQKAVTLKVLNLPAQWNEKWKITFQSENKAIAAVSEEGIITARNVGNTKVICTVVNKKTNKSIYTYTCAVTVKENAKSVSIENLPKDNLMAIGVPQDFNARLKSSTGAKATDNTEWIISDNTAGAKVNNAGVVTALKAGTFTLTAKTYPDKVLLKNLGSKAYTAVSKAVIIRVLGDDIVSGEQIVNGTYSYENKKIGNLIIKKSVGDSKINLNKVHIAGKLILENNAGYMITVKDSYINQTETQKTSEDSAKSNPFEKFIQIGVIKVNAAGEEKTPELIVGDGSTISIINVGGTISIKQEGTANITSIQVTANASGEVEVKLAGFNGNLVVDTGAGTSTTVTTTECNITTATIMGNSSDKKVELRDTNAGTDRASSIGTVKVSSAAEIVLDVKTEVLTVSSQAVKAAVTVSQPVSVLQNSGAESKLVISAEVKSINSEGEKAQIQVEKNGKVENVTTSGNSTEIRGEGQVVTAVVTGDNTSVNTGGTKVEVKEEVKGVKVGNEEIKGGTTTVSTVTPSPTVTPTPSPAAVIPTTVPTTAPTTVPTTAPTTVPTATPTATPTAVPTIPLDPEAKEKEIYSQCKPLLDKALSIWSEDYENRFDETNKGPQDRETKAKTLYLTVKSLIDKLNLIDSTILSDAIEPVSELKNISDTDQVLTYNILMHRRMGSFAAEDVLKDDGTSIYTLDDYYIADTKAYSLYNAKQVRNGAYLLAAYYEAINESVPNFRDGKIHTAILDVLETFQELKTEEYKNTDSWWSIKADDFSKLKEKLTALYLLEDASVIPNFNEEGQKDTAYYKNILTAGDNNFYRRLAEPLLYDLNTEAAPPAFSLKKYYDNKSTMSEYYETYGDWFVLGNINYNMIEAEKDNKNLQVKNPHVKEAAQLLLDNTVTLEKKKAALFQIIEDQEFNEDNTYDIWYKTGEIDEDGNDIWGVVKQGIYQKDELESIINNPEYLPYIVNAIRSDISDPGNNKANDYNPLHAILFYNEISTDVLKYHTDYQIAEDAKWSLLYRIVSEAYFREATLKEAVDNIIETLKTETSAEEDGVDIIGSVYDRKLDKETGEYYNEVKKGFQIIADDMSYTEDEQEVLREVKDNDTYYKVLIKTLAQTMYFDSASDIYKIAGQSDATIEMYWRAFHEVYQTWLQVRELTNSKVFTAVDELIAAVKSNMEIKTGRDDATNETYSYTALKDNASIDDIQNAVEKLEKSYSVSSDDMYNAHREASADIPEEDPGYDIQAQSFNNSVLKEITGDNYYILKIAENLAWNCLYEEPNPENQSCLYKIAHATTEEPVSSEEFYNYYSGAVYDVYCNVMNAYYDKAYETFLCLRQLTGSVKAAVSGSSLEVTEEGDKLDRIGDSLWRTLDLKYHSDWQDSEMTRDDIGLYMTRENIRLITADILKEGYVSPSESGSISWKNINLNTFSTEKEDITHYYGSILEVLNSLHTVLMSQKEDFEPTIQAFVSEIKQNFYLDNENSVAPSSVADYDGIKEKLKSFWELYYHRTEENADFMSFLENDIYLRDYALRVAYNIYRPQDNMDLQVVANEIEIPDNANDRRNLFQNVGNWLLEDIKDIQANGSDNINFTKAQIITLAMQATEATVVSGGSIELNTETPGAIDSIKETLNGLIDRFHFTSLDSNKLPSEVEEDSIAGFLKNILSNEEQNYIERIILALGSRIKLPEGISDGSDFAKIALEDSSITDITYSNAFWDIINTIIRVYVLK